MSEKKNKKLNPLVVGGGALLIIIFGFFIFGRKGKNKMELPQKEETEQEAAFEAMVLDENKEPEIELSLDSSLSRGSLTVSGIDPAFSALEYEFIYVSDYQGSMVERGISSGGSVAIPASGIFTKSLVFGVESCTTDRCHFTAEKVEIDQPATLILRFLDEEDNVWELEKEMTFEKEGTGYTGIFND